MKLRGTNEFIGEYDLSDNGAKLLNSSNDWVIARPEGYKSFWFTLKCAWKVLTHQADIVIWEEQE